MANSSVVSMKALLEAVHFGHQTRRWTPKMTPYIYTERNGIYIVDLQKTVRKLEEAYSFVRQLSESGQSLLFVGTKKQAQEAIKDEALRCNMYYVNARWLGGMMTNFKTMRTRVDRLNQLKTMQEDGTFDMLPKKEVMKHLGEIEKLNIFADVKSGDFEQFVNEGKIKYIGQDVIDEYIANVKKQSIHPELCAKSGLKVVYTPLNGAGNKPVRRILKEIGINNVVVVKEQEMPDGNFTTCPYPNPEIKEALHLGLELCKTEKPDLLLATDPDSDRVGIAVPDGDKYVLFTGNEVGAMLLEYICKERTAAGTMPANPVAVKTIVTTDLVKSIAAQYGLELREVLTGFKFIGEQIGFLEAKGEENRYIFGFEESYGYLAGSYVRDKDAVVASMLICEMAAFYRSQGISLVQARAKMYSDYGFYCNKLDTFTFEGETGMKKMNAIMDTLRNA